MPLAPAAVTMTAPPALAASSRASARSSEAELSIGGSAMPAAASMPARMMSMLDESIESGTLTVGASTPTSHSIASICSCGRCEYSSTLTSRYCAPASTWRTASACR